MADDWGNLDLNGFMNELMGALGQAGVPQEWMTQIQQGFSQMGLGGGVHTMPAAGGSPTQMPANYNWQRVEEIIRWDIAQGRYQNIRQDLVDQLGWAPMPGSWVGSPQDWQQVADVILWDRQYGGNQLDDLMKQLGWKTDNPPGTTIPQDNTQIQLDAKAYIDSVLGLYDLGGLSDRAWQQIVQGTSSTPELMIQWLRQQQEYKDRFKGMAIRAEKGLPAISEGEYISYERQAFQLMRDADMPPEFWDQRDDFANLIGKDVSINELNQRIANGYTKVKQAPQEVRDAFGFYYGAAGDGALAAMFLDPDRAGQTLQRMALASESGGYGRTFGFNISQNMAESMAARNVTGQEAQRGFQQLDVERGYYDETITEGLDLSAEFHGTESQFGINDESAAKVRRRKEERASQFAGAAGGGATPQGAVGLGSARR